MRTLSFLVKGNNAWGARSTPSDRTLRLELRWAGLFWHNLEESPRDRPSEGGRAFRGRDLNYDFRDLHYDFFRMFDLFNVLLNYLLGCPFVLLGHGGRRAWCLARRGEARPSCVPRLKGLFSKLDHAWVWEQ